MATNPRMEQYREKIAAFSDREKWMILVTGFVLIVGILDFFVIQPLRDQRAVLEQQTISVRNQQANFAEQQTDLLAQIQSDPAMNLEQRIEGLEKAINNKENELKEYTQSLVSPVEMTEMLHSLLTERKGLKLIELENLKVTPLLEDKGSKKDDQQTPDFGLYRHPVRLVFEGNFSDTLEYLQKLEQLPNKFYWHRFDYQVLEYPKAQVSINIYTLSTQQWWIGDHES